MLLDRFTQQPNEVRVRKVDYSNFLSSGELVDTSSAVSALYSGSANDSGNPFTVTSVTVDPNQTAVWYTTSGGANGNTYKVTFTTDTTPTQQTKEDEILIRIKEV